MSDDESKLDNVEQVKEIEEPDVDQEVYYPPLIILKERVHQTIKTGLKKIAKTSDGYSYAYSQLMCENKQLTSLYDVMQNYQHLRKINLGNNRLSNCSSFQKITYLTHLDLRKNQIKSLSYFNDHECFQFLVDLNLSNNLITELEQLTLPRLNVLVLNSNLIVSCEKFKGNPNIASLELRKNKLKSLNGIQDMPNLIELFAAENELVGFKELRNLPQLKKLHLRKNQISSFEDVPQLPLLHHLNVRENAILKLDEFRGLLKLRIGSLTALQNPVSEEVGDSMKKELVMILQELVRVNKEERYCQVTQDEKQDALNELKERVAEIERKRKEEEEEQLRLADEARQAEEQKLQEQQQADD